jgi:hypothetical protein
MKNKTKGMLIAAIVLIFTLGTLMVRSGGSAGLYWATNLDVILALPIIPLMPLTYIIPGLDMTQLVILATILWLCVGYLIGKQLDKKKK